MRDKSPYVLMLENDKDDRYFTQSTMEELGLNIRVEYGSWSEQLPSAVAQNAPVLILLAYNPYPDTSVNVLRTFKQNPSLSHIPIVVLSEDLPSSDMYRYYAAGANSVIKKPSTVALTRHKVQTFFSYWFSVAEL